MFNFMLASDAEIIEQVKFPVLCSAKLDGVRGGVRDGVLLARSLKEIPNRYCQGLFGRSRFSGLDGELTVGKPNASDVFNKTTSAVMTRTGEPLVTLNVFDWFERPDMPYEKRLMMATSVLRMMGTDNADVRVIKHTLISCVVDLLTHEKLMLDKGYEGLVLRDPRGVYKHGRSTFREGGLLRLTRTVTAEALVLSVEEGEENTNAKTLESKGRAKRSSHADGKVPNGMLGAFNVRDIKTGVEFSLGTGQGLTIELRKALWKKRGRLVGKLVKYESKAVGVKMKPRQPIWLGFRDAKDLS